MGEQLFSRGSNPLERVKEDKGGREVPRDDVKGNTIPSQELNDGVDDEDDFGFGWGL